MERIIYRKTLDVHKNGIQFTLQGFETADNMSRRIEITLMASGDTIDLPLEQLVAMMYVTTPNATEPSINECTIKDNTIIYDVLPIVESGITEMQLKLIETRPNGANGVLATPKFAVEVSDSGTNEESATQSTTYTALEDAIAKAQGVYDSRFLRIEIGTDCTFRAYYADGTIYESDIFKGEAVLAQSYAVGGTGIRVGEDTDNSKYYSSVSESASAEASRARTETAELLEEVTKHGVYTSFDINFETGEVNYISPQYDFEINKETGCLEAIGEAYNAEESQKLLIDDWLTAKSMELEIKTGGISERVSTIEENTDSMYNELEVLSDDVQALKNNKNTLEVEVENLTTQVNKNTTKATTMEDDIDKAKGRIDYLENTVLDGVFNIENGGTGANNVEEARENLGVVSKDDVKFKIYNSLSTIGLSGKVTTDEVFAEMPEHSVLIFNNHSTQANSISDLPTTAMLVELTKTTTWGTGRATQINNKDANFYDYSWYKKDTSSIVSSGWKQPSYTVAATSSDGIAYTAIVEGITALKTGISITVIPNMSALEGTANLKNLTLNVNNLGAKKICRRLSSGTVTRYVFECGNPICANYPVHLTYDGTFWIITDLPRPSGEDIHGTVPISHGGTGATTATAARTSLGLVQNILWEGESQVDGLTKVNLENAVSAQPNGIVLVFSALDERANVQDYYWNEFFIPKTLVSKHNHKGHSFNLTESPTDTVIHRKYLIVGDTYISGHEGNVAATYDANGKHIVYNSRFVLRYVIGV